jgi:hypothetical protein
MLWGCVTFSAVSVLAYSIWAYRLIPGTAAMYASTAAVYIGLSGLALSRLVSAPRQRKRFPLIFAGCFIIYAICWCACWFGLGGKFRADLIGSIVGLAAMTALLQSGLGRKTGFLLNFAVLLALHSVGYYAGGELHELVRGSGGRLLWGAAHGAGFGAGLGYVLFRLQAPLSRSAPAAHVKP